MTKKRFIKLLMAQGMQRNEAHKTAERYHSMNKPYAVAYIEYKRLLSWQPIAQAFRGVGEAAQKSSIALGDLYLKMREIEE